MMSHIDPDFIPEGPELAYPDPLVVVDVEADEKGNEMAKYRDLVDRHIKQLTDWSKSRGPEFIKVQETLKRDLMRLQSQKGSLDSQLANENKIKDALMELVSAWGADFDMEEISSDLNFFFEAASSHYVDAEFDHDIPRWLFVPRTLRLVSDRYPKGTAGSCLANLSEVSEELERKMMPLEREIQFCQFRISIASRLLYNAKMGISEDLLGPSQRTVTTLVASGDPREDGVIFTKEQKRRALMALAVMERLKKTNEDLENWTILQLEQMVKDIFNHIADHPLNGVRRALKGKSKRRLSDFYQSLSKYLVIDEEGEKLQDIFRRKVESTKVDLS